VPASVNVGAFPIETVPKLASMLARTGSADTCGADGAQAASRQSRESPFSGETGILFFIFIRF
jgi:hypothetical protein